VNCLDAETLAAWFDGGLRGAALENVRAHVAGCGRCQLLLGAMGTTRAAVPVPQPERAPRRWLAWAVPLAAAATAIAVWVAIPEQRNVPAVAPATAPEATQEAALPPAAPPGADTQQQEANARSATSFAPPPVEQRAQRNAATPGAASQQAAAPQTAAPATAPPAAEPSAAAPLAAPRPEGRVLDQQQRAAAARAAPAAPQANDAAKAPAPLAESVTIAGETRQAPSIENLCGRRWGSVPSDVAGGLTAGSSPSADVCWVVGRGGVIRRSINGQTWQAVTFREMTDLSGVQASDARSATVSTADGRSFRTSDGGTTWVQQ
jgi:hypothetical protein